MRQNTGQVMSTKHPQTKTLLRHIIAACKQKNVSAKTIQTMLELGINKANTMSEFQALFEATHNTVKSENPNILAALAKLGCVVRQWDFVLQKTNIPTPTTELKVYKAFALLRHNNTKEALKLIQKTIQDCEGELLGWALRIEAESLAVLKRQTWQEHFEQACKHLEGRALGACLIEYGNHLLATGERKTARRTWLQALPILQHDPYYRSWLHYNLGILCLGDLLLPEAESHFLEMLNSAKKNKSTKSDFARAWCGIGAARRALGEWPRAEAAYREAIRRSTEIDDKQEAWRGLGHTYRISGRAELAPEALGIAAKLGADWVWAEMAAMWLMLDDEAAATEALTRLRPNNPGDEQQAMIVRAEMARRHNDTKSAMHYLKKIIMQTLWVSEEQRCFPELFKLMHQHKLGNIKKLPNKKQTTIEVNTKGILRVRVNKRNISLRPTGRTAELLVLLLEHNNAASSETLIEALYPNTGSGPVERRKKTRAIWQLVKELRQAFGWNTSVTALNNAYRLDPESIWKYDREHDKNTQQTTNNFLEGNYSEWVQRVRQGNPI